MKLNPFTWLRDRKLKAMHAEYERRKAEEAEQERLRAEYRARRLKAAQARTERRARWVAATPPDPVLPMPFTHDQHVPPMLTPTELGQRVDAGESWKVFEGSGGSYDGAGASGDWSSVSDTCSSSSDSSSSCGSSSD